MAQAEYVTNSIRAPIPGVNAHPCTSHVGAAHAEFVAAQAGQHPHSNRLNPDTSNIKDRADHSKDVFAALSLYVTTRIGIVLSDLTSDMTGTIQCAADRMAGRVA